MARLTSAYTRKPREPIIQERIAAARTFRIGQDVRAGKRFGKVKHIDHRTGMITVANGKRMQSYAAELLDKNE